MNKLLATLIVSAGLAGVPHALAQNTPAPGAETQARPGPHAGGMHRHHAQRAQIKPSERVEARLAYIRTALKITDAQQPQWEAFADVLRKHGRQMDELRARRIESAQSAQPRPVTAVERLELRQQRMTLASQRLGEVLAAAKPLYAALSPEQQKIADDMLARQGHGRRGHHHGMRHGA